MTEPDRVPPLWHTMDVERVTGALDVDPARGLNADEVARRRTVHGANALRVAVRRTPLRMLLAQCTDVMVLVLVGAAIVAALVGDAEDTIAILAIVVLNAMLGFVQEYRAEQALAALGALAAPSARVRRDGAAHIVPTHELVPGDIVLLEAGNVVPADLRIVDAVRLSIEEAALTGESLPVEKRSTPILEPHAPLGDRHGMAYKGTSVAAGRGVGVVVAIGMHTELGRIADMLQDEEEARSPLQRRLAAFGRRLALLVLVLCAAIFVTGLLRGEPLGLMFMTALSLAVAAIPEALPAVVTVSLALGARRMVRQQALIRRLPAVETLGSVTYICTDKTGTLTENRMAVDTVREGAGTIATGTPATTPDLPLSLADVAALCTDVQYLPDGTLLGDPTETALVRWASDQGADRHRLEQQWPRVGEIPFTSERARMTTVHAARGARIACTKGAPERVVPSCTQMLHDGHLVPIDRRLVLEHAERMAADGLRVLAIATRSDRHHPQAEPATLEDDQVLLALVGLLDPPRREAAAAIRTCHAAGIRVVMITGDHPATATAIARRLGLGASGAHGVEHEVLTGPQLTTLDDAALAQRVQYTSVYARVAPEDKLRIVKALQARGEFAAMTGDGVNDAPALKRANIGIAMGRGGTDVAREASHMVLLDDDFATIVQAVREGRRIYDNIRRFVRFVLSTNSGEIWTLFLAPLLGLPLPLLPIHILWMNLVTDGLPGLALSAERAEADIMQRPPRPPREGIFAHGLWQHAVWVGLLMAALALGTQAWALQTGHGHWQTMTFTVLTLSQLTHILAIRSERQSLFTIGLTSNPLLLLAVLATFALQMGAIYLPAMNRILHTTPLSAGELSACLLIALVVFIAVEVEKLLARQGRLYAAPRTRTP